MQIAFDLFAIAVFLSLMMRIGVLEKEVQELRHPFLKEEENQNFWGGK